MNKNTFSTGLELLQQPVLPLVSMIQFFLMTGPFDTVTAVINELPETIETDYTTYKNPVELCNRYLAQLQDFELLKADRLAIPEMITEQGEPVDSMTAGSSWILQQILTEELVTINSVLCGPCNCTLCCTGPDGSMNQEFFEIPLQEDETHYFDIQRHDTKESRESRSMNDVPLFCEDLPFYATREAKLFHWQNGWSLILPKNSYCPNLLNNSGHCTVYAERPTVCRRPQIFPYIIEPMEQEEGDKPLYRIRNSLLAITDCPYVTLLQDEISAYAAANELALVLSQNKQ